MTPFAYKNDDQVGPILRRLKNRRVQIIILGIVFSALFIFFSNKGVVRRMILEQELTDAQDRVTTLKSEIAQLRVQRQELETDSAAIVHVAREQHGMIRPGEVVFRIRYQTPDPTE